MCGEREEIRGVLIMNDIIWGTLIIIAVLSTGCVDPMPVYATYIPDDGPSVDLRPKRIDQDLLEPPKPADKDQPPAPAEARDDVGSPELAPKTVKDALPCGPVVDLNEATEQELQRLKGVGPATAARITAARQKRPFRHPNHLRRVKGIGPKTMQRLRPCIRVQDCFIRCGED